MEIFRSHKPFTQKEMTRENSDNAIILFPSANLTRPTILLIIIRGLMRYVPGFGHVIQGR